MKAYGKRLLALLFSTALIGLLLCQTTFTASAVANPNNVGMTEHAQKALKEKWGYFYGTYGQIGTQSLLDAKCKQYPTVYNSILYDGRTVYQHAQQWIGGRVADCIGLMKSYIWWDNAKNGPVYNSKTDKGANSTYSEATKKGDITTIPETHGVLVWKEGHIGVYIGNGKVIEARGTAYGVVETNLHERSWTNWCYYKQMSYKTDTNGYYTINGGSYRYVNKEYVQGWYENRYYGSDGKMRTGVHTFDGGTFDFGIDGLLKNNPGVASVCIDKKLAYVRLGKTFQLEATSNVKNTKITWTSSDKNIATVSSTGLVKGIKEGSVTITATEPGGNTSKSSIKVQNIYRIVSAKASKTTVEPKEKVNFTVVTGINDEAMRVYINGTLSKTLTSGFTRSASVHTWTIPLTFDSAGSYTVKFLAGTEKIPSNSKSITIKVRESFTAGGGAINMKTGDTHALKITSPDPIASYASANKKVATVDEAGVVKAIAPGSTVVTVKNSKGAALDVIIIVDNQYVSLRIGYKKAIANDKISNIDDSGASPYIKSGRTMLPLRFINTKMNAKVLWTSNTKPVTVTYGKTQILFTVGKKSITIKKDGKTSTVAIDCAPEIKGGRMYIPIRAVSQSLGFQVKYDDASRVVVVSNPSMCEALVNYRFSEAKKSIK